jgi:glycolate oxidase
MREQFTDAELEQMERLKRAFDPQALLNPGKVIPAPNRCGDMGMMKAVQGALSRA